MFSRRSWRALVLSLLCLAAFVVPVSFSNAVQVTNANENARTLSLSLPGTFNGCAYLDTGATASTSAILDLVRPSAFITAANGTLVGENGPIASAELSCCGAWWIRVELDAADALSSTRIGDPSA